MTHWFTSDLHLGHENVALTHRGARSVEQHDQAIVSNLLRCLQSGATFTSSVTSRSAGNATSTMPSHS